MNCWIILLLLLCCGNRNCGCNCNGNRSNSIGGDTDCRRDSREPQNGNVGMMPSIRGDFTYPFEENCGCDTQ
ncbi:MAG: hypothetical protein IJ747_06405 [Lachnospiraceae bacterium]|nr:hypothetical protein [Lachnospiraceae bacterium]